jgi:hypothetical protein
MSKTENIEEPGMKGELPGQQLLRLQSEIEGQGHRVAKAVNPILEVLDKGEIVSLEMMSHLKAQILLAHLQLDELGQLLESFD